MKKIEIDKIFGILNEFMKQYDIPSVNELGIKTRDPFKVLIAGILSARSKDEITNKASEKLFSKAKNFEELKKLKLEEIKDCIKPVRFYNNKAKYLEKLPKIIETEFQNKIPDELEELIKLPGVGRKTANLVLVAGFRKKAICVDVHLNRIFNRLGYIKTKNPYETEIALREKLPKKFWLDVNRIFVAFGQNLCRPISPYCSRCPIIKYCNQVKVEKKR